jgi:chorismate mutase
MGLLTGLLGLPLAPVRGTIAVAEQVLKQAEEEFYDPARIRAELDDVARAREDGTLTDDEATAREDELIERLMTGQQRAREGRHG